MAGIDIANKIAKGLANATKAVGGDGGKVEIKRATAEMTTPWQATRPLEYWVELKNCIFKAVNVEQVSGELIQIGDIEFTSNSSELVLPGDTLRRDGTEYEVKTVSPVAPSGVVLLYKGTARAA